MVRLLGLACAVGVVVFGTLAVGDAASAQSFLDGSVAAIFNVDGRERDFECTGSLISPSWILTHTSCIWDVERDEMPDNTIVRLGDSKQNFVNKTISAVAVHPSYDDVNATAVYGTTGVEVEPGTVAMLKLSEAVLDFQPLAMDWSLPTENSSLQE